MIAAGVKDPMRPLTLTPVVGLPLFQPGDSIGATIAAALTTQGYTLIDGDVLVVAQKIVSKAEGRLVRLADMDADAAAEELAAVSGKPVSVATLILAESSAILRARRDVVISRHRTGHVAANAGIDASNIPGGGEEQAVLLWPVDPDASAAALRRELYEACGVQVAVIIADSLGRAWRMGTIGTAIGAAGISALWDRRGEIDLYGRTLRSTLVAVADGLADTASLVMGEGAEAMPAVVIRGARFQMPDVDRGARELVRPVAEDMFL